MRPKLRLLDISASEGGYVLSDPYLPGEESLWLSQAAMTVASLLDGERTIAEFHAYLHGTIGADVPLERLQAIVETLDRAGFLDTPEARERLAAAEAAFLASGVRPLALAGQSYPTDAQTCTIFLEAMRAVAPPWPPRGPLSGLLLPHLELRRVPEVYGAALDALALTPVPTRVLLVGVAHQPIAELAAALPLDLETPYGRLPVDHQAIAALNAALPFELCNSPLAFRHEHSIEFPAALLHGSWPTASFSVIPLIVGGSTDTGALAALTAAIASLAETHPFFPVASVDLSHVGARFDDPPLNRPLAEAARDMDQRYLQALALGHFEAAYTRLVDAGNPTRIDAYASVQALHRAIAGTGEVLAYQLSAEAESASAVGAGAIAYRR